MPDATRIPASADALVREVMRLTRKNPGDRAMLRHSLGKPSAEAALGVHRIVVPFLPDPPDESRKATGYSAAERAYYAIAALIASQPRGARDQAADFSSVQETAPGPEASPPRPGTGTQEQRRWRNLGYSLAQAAEQGGNARSLENHLQLLMRQDADGLYRHLPRLILQLRSDQVRIDWGVLICDLTRWADNPRLVAKEWAQSYYRTSERLTAARAKKATASASKSDKETRS